MPRAKSLLALLVVAIALVLVFLPRGGDTDDDATTAKTITLYGYSDGTLLWEIRAAGGRVNGDDQTLSDVAIDFHGSDAATLRIRGDRLDRTEGTARLSGNLRIERTDDLLLETEAVTWIEADERLEAGPIALTTETLDVSAAGFEYDLASETATFTGGVEAIADLESTWTIRASDAEERDGVVSFRHGVTAESEGGESFRCERLEVDSNGEAARLVGEAEGEWSSGRLTAASIRMDEDGLHASGGVTARLDLEEMGAADDT